MWDVSPDGRRALLTGALGFLLLRNQPPEFAPLRRWLGLWAGLGAILDGMVRQGFDVALTRNDDPGWRALVFPSSFIHESRSGAAWGAVQDAAQQRLRAECICGVLSCHHSPKLAHGLRHHLIAGFAAPLTGAECAWGGADTTRSERRPGGVQ